MPPPDECLGRMGEGPKIIQIKSLCGTVTLGCHPKPRHLCQSFLEIVALLHPKIVEGGGCDVVGLWWLGAAGAEP